MLLDLPSYLLAPHSSPTPRDRKIQLGNIFEHPLKVYDFPISRPNSALLETVSPSRDLPNVTVNKSSTWGAGLWARFLPTFRFTVDAGRSKTFSMNYSDVRTAHTEEPDLQKGLDKTDIFSGPVYMVVGIQYAMSMTYEITRLAGGQGHLGGGGHVGPNVDAGAAAAGATADHDFYLKDIVPVWVTEAALSDTQAGDNEEYSDEDANTQDCDANAAGKGAVGANEVKMSTFREEHVVTIH